MQIIPVLDIQNGIVVRAVGGRRSDYRPLVSRLTDSTDPLAVAQAIRSRYGFDEFYLADLDAIAGAAPAIATYDQLRAGGLRLWVDAGVRDATDVELIADHADQMIVGLETLSGPSELQAMCKLFLPSPPASGGEGMGVRGVGATGGRK
jgi:phosphoribosylformimino-5-aminoimidazole carboxamide ribotide isomerase